MRPLPRRPTKCLSSQSQLSLPHCRPLRSVSLSPSLSVPCGIYFEPSVVRPLGQFSSRRQRLDTALIIGLFACSGTG